MPTLTIPNPPWLAEQGNSLCMIVLFLITIHDGPHTTHQPTLPAGSYMHHLGTKSLATVAGELATRRARRVKQTFEKYGLDPDDFYVVRQKFVVHWYREDRRTELSEGTWEGIRAYLRVLEERWRVRGDEAVECVRWEVVVEFARKMVTPLESEDAEGEESA